MTPAGRVRDICPCVFRTKKREGFVELSYYFRGGFVEVPRKGKLGQTLAPMSLAAQTRKSHAE